MCLLVIIAAIMLGFVTWGSEVSIRSSGYVLQFFGMIFAIRGILSIRDYFKQPLLKELVLNWLKRFPKWNKDACFTNDVASMKFETMKSRVETWSPDDPNLPINERVEKIIYNLEMIRIKQSSHTKSIDDLKDSHEEHKQETEERVIKMEENFHTEQEVLHTGDLGESIVGLVWLTVGITMSTMSQELYKWLY